MSSGRVEFDGSGIFEDIDYSPEDFSTILFNLIL